MRGHERFKKDVQYEIDQFSASEDLPKPLTETAKTIYNQFHTEEFAFVRDKEVYALASIAIAAQMHDYPLQIRDLQHYIKPPDSENWNENRRVNTISRAKRKMMKELNIPVEPSDPRNFINRFADGMGLDDDVVDLALDIIDKTSTTGSGRAPSSVAASALYAAAKLKGLNLTQAKVCDVANVSRVTVRKTYQDQLEKYKEVESSA